MSLAATALAALAMSIALGAGAQILLKLASTAPARLSWAPSFLNEYFVLAVALYGTSLILYVLSLRDIPLTVAYPSIAISYVIVAGASAYLWGTPFGLREVAALALILAGVFLLAGSAQGTGA